MCGASADFVVVQLLLLNAIALPPNSFGRLVSVQSSGEGKPRSRRCVVQLDPAGSFSVCSCRWFTDESALGTCPGT